MWDPILVPGAKKTISYYFLKEVNCPPCINHNAGLLDLRVPIEAMFSIICTRDSKW